MQRRVPCADVFAPLQFPLPARGKILNPQSQPTYFQDLLRELEEAPNRTWLQNVSKRLAGMFRWE